MSVVSGIVAFRLADQNGSQALKRFRERPEIQQEIERFRTALRDIKSVDDFYQNDRAYRFVLEAGNLAGDIPFRGKVQRILGESHLDEESLMFKLTDDRFKKLASKLQFATRGVDRLKLPFVTNQIIDDFVKARYEQSLGDQNPGVPVARYFRENIGSVKSEFGILGDPKLREVILTSLNIPKQIAVQPVESQAEVIKSRVNLKDFEDEAFLEKFLQRYLINKDRENAQANGLSGGQGSYVLALFGGGGGPGGLNINLLV